MSFRTETYDSGVVYQRFFIVIFPERTLCIYPIGLILRRYHEKNVRLSLLLCDDAILENAINESRPNTIL